MIKKCINCSKKGFFLVKTRELQLSGKKLLCNECYCKLLSKEKIKIKAEKKYFNLVNTSKKIILNRMTNNQLKNYCQEKAIPIYIEKIKYSNAGEKTNLETYKHYYEYNELVSILSLRFSIEDIINHIKRECKDIYLNDILRKLKEIS